MFGLIAEFIGRRISLLDPLSIRNLHKANRLVMNQKKDALRGCLFGEFSAVQVATFIGIIGFAENLEDAKFQARLSSRSVSRDSVCESEEFINGDRGIGRRMMHQVVITALLINLGLAAVLTA